jgi:hypothetical protein
MQDALACPSCRWWRRLGPRSSVGRCGNKRSGLAYTNYRGCCAHHQPRATESADPKQPAA